MTDNRLNAYHIMWLFVLFDLPVTSKKENREAAIFRRELLKDGFVMLQYSVYIRHCASYESLAVHKKKIKALMPETGKVSLLVVTDKQYGDIDTFFGKAAKKEIKAPVQLELF